MVSQPALFIALILSLLSQDVFAQTFLSINTEWFWDELPPHEGGVVGEFDDFPPTKGDVDLKAFALAQVILNSKADLVALQEIENGNILRRIRRYLPTYWQTVFSQGRDTYTGQDVGFLTRLSLIPDTMSTFPHFTGEYSGRKAKPSKVLGAGFLYSGEKYYVITAHLLSKRRNSAEKDQKRAAQAKAIYSALKSVEDEYEHLVIMGDFNDTPSSPTLVLLKGSESEKQLLYQTANLCEDSKIVSLPKYDTLIDHILVGDSLIGRCRDLKTIILGPLSDHNGVVLECN